MSSTQKKKSERNPCPEVSRCVCCSLVVGSFPFLHPSCNQRTGVMRVWEPNGGHSQPYRNDLPWIGDDAGKKKVIVRARPHYGATLWREGVCVVLGWSITCWAT